MELGIIERLTIPTLFPQQSNYATAAVCKALGKEIALTPEEQEAFEVRNAMGQLSGYTEEPVDGEGNPIPRETLPPIARNFEIGERAFQIVADALRKMDDENKLAVQHVSLYEKFVLEPRQAREEADAAVVAAEQATLAGSREPA